MIGRDIGARVARGQIASERRREVLRYRASRHLLDLGGFLLTHHASLATATSHRLRTALTSPLTSRTTTTS